MRITALVLALTAAAAWGLGGLVLKRATDVVSASTIVALQYAIGLVIFTGWILVTIGVSESAGQIGRRWPLLLLLICLQIGGYIAFVLAVKFGGPGSLPTATVVAIVAVYPAFVAVLSGPVLGETLQWNHALAVALIITGVLVAQVL